MKNVPFLLILAFIAGSCSHSYYVSNVQNVPLFEGRNELSLSGSLASGTDATSAELQATYSLTDRLGLTGDYMNALSGNVEDRNYSTENFFSFGAGYYEPVNDVVSFAIYGGVGNSVQHHEYTSEFYEISTGSSTNEYKGSSEVKYMKYYLQPQVGFRHKYVQFGISTRLSMLDYYNIVDNSTLASGSLNEIGSLNHIYFEPAFTLRAGGEVVKFQFQAAFSAKFRDIDYAEYRHDFAHFSMGVYFTIPSGKKKHDRGI